MEAIKIEGMNVVVAENQNEYETIHGHVDPDDPQGVITYCFRFSEEELVEIAKTNRIYVQLMTFKCNVQPINITTKNPIQKSKDD